MVKNNKKEKKFSRYSVFFIAMTVIFSVIIFRLLYLQVVLGEEYKEEASKKHYKNVSKVAPRGDIVDKNGEILATSKQSYALMFTETPESREVFFDTMEKVFKVLDENKTPIVDEFPIVVEPKFEFKFNAADEASRRWMELRFKKDRGLQEKIIDRLYKGKNEDELSENESKKVDEELLKITAEEAFNKIFDGYKNEFKKSYDIDIDEKNYSLSDKRRYIIVLDSIKMQSYSGYKPVVISNSLSKDVAFIFEQLQPDLPGIMVETQPIRSYPNGELGSAFLGYTAKIDSWEKEKFEEKGYDVSSDKVGKAGLEYSFESILKGTKGQESIEVNKQGRKVKTLGEVEAYPGKTLKLNIDKKIQQVAEKALDDTMENLQKQGRSNDVDSTNATRGAAVVMEAKTGKILALASRPGYDPNIFTLTPELTAKYYNSDLAKMGREYIEKRGLASMPGLLSDNDLATLSYEQRVNKLVNLMFPLDKRIEGNTKYREDSYDIFPKPLYNYATLSLIPPGSVFKPLTGFAGLEEGVIDLSTTIYDDGEYNKRYPDYKGACWIYNQSGGSHGSIDIRKALEVSCNYFFYDVADRLFAKGGEKSSGLDYIAKYAWKFGLGVDKNSNKEPKTGIEIPENFGQVYNYESSRMKFANEYVDQLANFLNEGKDSINTEPHYKPINIRKKDEIGTEKEKSAIAEVNKKKTVLIDAIKEEMQKETKGKEQEIVPKMKQLLKDLIEDVPEFKEKNYTDKDIENMAIAINYSIADAVSNRKSAANAYDAAIGQGMNQFTPLQLTNYMATLVNGGYRYEMHLVDSIIDPVTEEETVIEPELLEKVDINPEYLQAMKEGMANVVTSTEGTGATAFLDYPLTHGGKTGSASFTSDPNKEEALGRTSYAVYLGFAPLDDPEIVTCVVIFDGGHGGHAGPVVRAIYEQYFKEELLKINPGYQFMYPEIVNGDKDKTKDNNENTSNNENTKTNNEENTIDKNIDSE
ncbi:MAG: penicillin-binding protein [Clostridium argentinense]|uniref:Penicillin-binding protein n=1 Tax=Clostridium faecium TaxID=2762223 RepID=A0ABR8YUW4_9CLOT|nr:MULTISPECIES: penicillin-binding transpeptidase domain-containing protein [Clostridium]MBD8048073.1 penicillin-binding protein [Clostridium faecium]MBS5824711.1 penicillin-binding protein [Clostridium argentinense]MDU1348194.1 penicillin-binding transpeptidase domain-containing protein [Clostridium argentinense]